MISYGPLWKTMHEKKVTSYKLIKDYNLSRGTLDNLKHDRNLNIETIASLCRMLDCRIEDIVEYISEDQVR